jgi:Holliday junction resolvase
VSGARSRNKGAAGEREFLRALGGELGIALSRNLLQTRESGCDCLEVKGYAIEIKRRKTRDQLSRPAWWRQACRQAEAKGVEPLMAYRVDGNKQWTCWVHTRDGQYKVCTVAEAAGIVREKWARLWGTG